MFFPLHDQNNEQVKTVPMASYVVIGLCFLIHLYSVILGFGPTGSSNLTRFIYKHGLIPSVYLSDSTTYPISFRRPTLTREQQKLLAESGFKNFPEPEMVQSSSLWVWLMPLTCIFLHASWMHLLTNLWFFWIFSDNVEEKMGTIKFSLFYLFVGFFSSMAHALIQSGSEIPLIGASGAVSGVMGAYLILFPVNKITSYFCPVWFFIRRIDVPAIVVLGFYLLLNMLQMYQSGAFGANIAFDAHIFGFLGGVGIASVLKKL